MLSQSIDYHPLHWYGRGDAREERTESGEYVSRTVMGSYFAAVTFGEGLDRSQGFFP